MKNFLDVLAAVSLGKSVLRSMQGRTMNFTLRVERAVAGSGTGLVAQGAGRASGLLSEETRLTIPTELCYQTPESQEQRERFSLYYKAGRLYTRDREHDMASMGFVQNLKDLSKLSSSVEDLSVRSQQTGAGKRSVVQAGIAPESDLCRGLCWLCDTLLGGSRGDARSMAVVIAVGGDGCVENLQARFELAGQEALAMSLRLDVQNYGDIQPIDFPEFVK